MTDIEFPKPDPDYPGAVLTAVGFQPFVDALRLGRDNGFSPVHASLQVTETPEGPRFTVFLVKEGV
mgnify:CR=1 FL=1